MTNYIDATLKIGSDFYLVFKDPNNKSFKVCKNATLNCNKINLTNDEIIDLLRGRLTINNHIYQYIGEYFDVRDDLATSELNKTQLIKYNKVKITSFGTLTAIEKKERLGRNPKTKVEAKIAARKVVRFKASDIIKKKINN